MSQLELIRYADLQQTATEDMRKNVNSFADELLGGNKSTHSTAGGTGDIHPDVKKTGEGIAQGIGAAAGKLGQATSDHKH